MKSEAEKAAEEEAGCCELMPLFVFDELSGNTDRVQAMARKIAVEFFLRGAAWAAPKWVRCSERMPGDEEVLIVWKGVVCTGWYMEAGEEMGAYWDISGRAMPVTNLEEVTHWMSKPAAPEVEK